MFFGLKSSFYNKKNIVWHKFKNVILEPVDNFKQASKQKGMTGCFPEN